MSLYVVRNVERQISWFQHHDHVFFGQAKVLGHTAQDFGYAVLPWLHIYISGCCAVETEEVQAIQSLDPGTVNIRYHGFSCKHHVHLANTGRHAWGLRSRRNYWNVYRPGLFRRDWQHYNAVVQLYALLILPSYHTKWLVGITH